MAITYRARKKSYKASISGREGNRSSFSEPLLLLATAMKCGKNNTIFQRAGFYHSMKHVNLKTVIFRAPIR